MNRSAGSAKHAGICALVGSGRQTECLYPQSLIDPAAIATDYNPTGAAPLRSLHCHVCVWGVGEQPATVDQDLTGQAVSHHCTAVTCGHHCRSGPHSNRSKIRGTNLAIGDLGTRQGRSVELLVRDIERQDLRSRHTLVGQLVGGHRAVAQLVGCNAELGQLLGLELRPDLSLTNGGLRSCVHAMQNRPFESV